MTYDLIRSAANKPGRRKHNVAATTAPTVNDDSDDGYSIKSIWVDVTNDKAYIAVDVTVGAAVWQQFSGAGVGVSDHGGLSGLGDDDHPQYVLESLLDAKGDLIAASADNTPAKVTVGANGSALVADSTQTAGLRWATGAVGEILISDTPSTPIVFADLLLTDDESDLLYADL